MERNFYFVRLPGQMKSGVVEVHPGDEPARGKIIELMIFDY
jgi:hypothetical protein